MINSGAVAHESCMVRCFLVLYARRFDQNLGSPLIYLFYMHATIRQKYMVFFHLISLFCTTIRPKTRVLIDLSFLCVRDHSAEIYVPLSFILYFEHDYSTKN